MSTFLAFWATLVRLFEHQLFKISGNPITLSSLILLVVVILISIAAGRWLKRLTSRLILSRDSHQRGVAYSAGIIVQYTTTLSGILFALDNIGISLTALAAFGAILTVGIGFGLQNVAQNFISGIILLLERPVQRGDFVIIGETIGTVDAISMRATRVISRDNVAIIVPNSKLITEVVINQSAPQTAYRARISLGVAYGSDTEKVRDALLRVAAMVPEVMKDPSAEVFFRDFGDSALIFELVVWSAQPGPEPRVTSALRFKIDEEFRRLAIEIPFPQRDLHLRSSAVSLASLKAAVVSDV